MARHTEERHNLALLRLVPEVPEALVVRRTAAQRAAAVRRTEGPREWPEAGEPPAFVAHRTVVVPVEESAVQRTVVVPAQRVQSALPVLLVAAAR